MFVLSFLLLLAVRDISAGSQNNSDGHGQLNALTVTADPIGQPHNFSQLQNCSDSDDSVVICNKCVKDNSKNLATKLMNIVKQPEVIIAFLMGITLSATVCCLASLCRRKKQKNPGNMVETLEMVTTEAAPLMDAGKSAGDDGTCDQGAAEAEAAGPSEPKEAEYSDIDFSRWSRKTPVGTGETQEVKETEYAEIKRDQKEDRQDDGGEEGEKLEGDEDQVVMMEEEEEKPQCGFAEEAKGEESEDVPTFSDMNDETEDMA